ncbi:MAG TPA: DNA repair protein RecN [Thermoanaerobaculia bacterium]|nr:DNA repair protein RecN [Thermoanaerobaculia bacterium]
MLRQLYVKNLAVVEEARVDLDGGLCVVTGETGAGKSLVVDSLSLLGGARASSDLIRTGAEVLTVVGVFEATGDPPWAAMLREAGLDLDARELVVRREVSRSGRNRVYLDDQPVALRTLSHIAPTLLRIHGQREELDLIEPELQRRWLDRSGGEEAQALLNRCGDSYAAWRAVADRLERLTGDERAREQRLDLLRFQLGEIEAASLVRGEEVELRQERELLRNSEEITRTLGDAVLALSDDEEASATTALGHARSALATLLRWDAQARGSLEEVEELLARADDLANTLRARLEKLDTEPGRLDVIEDRLALLERLLRKYGSAHAATSDEVLDLAQRLESEIDELTFDDERVEALRAECDRRLSEYRDAAFALSRARTRWARELEIAVAEQLAELALPRSRFLVRLVYRRRSDSPLEIEGELVELGAEGIDQVVFELSFNPGEEPRPLSKVASGGELARVYLALQVAVRGEGNAEPSTLVFDEVDAGLGGAQASVVGRKLRALGAGGQVLAVTHLPQVASAGHHQFRVKKSVEGERTRVAVEALTEDGRVDEIARMLAGERLTEASRSQARELLAESQAAPAPEALGDRAAGRKARASSTPRSARERRSRDRSA